MKKLFKTIILLVSLTGLGVWGGNAYAVVCTSAATGNWNAAATWAAGCGATGPAAADTVTISTGHTVTVTANAACTTLTVNAGGVLNISTFRIRPTGLTTIFGTVNFTGVSMTRFSGGVVLNAGGVWANTGNSAIQFRGGGLTNNGGTFTAGTGIYTFSTLAQAIGGTSPIIIPNVTVTTIALTNNGNLTASTALAGTGSLVNATATSVLNIGGTSAITTLTATAVGNTVNYTGAAAQIVKATAYSNLGIGGSVITALAGVTIANNLTLSGTASATPAAAFVIGGNLDVGVGSTFTSANFTNSVTGTTTVSGTLAHSGVAAKTYVGAVTINAGGVWTNAGNAPITLQGGLTNNSATFTAGTGIYTFGTTAAQALNCAAPLTIPSVTVTAPTVLTNNCALTVSTALAGTGNLTNGAAGILNIGGTSAITTLTASAVGNTVNFSGVAQTVNPTAYFNLGLSGSGAKTMTSVTAIGGNLNLSGTATMTANAAFTVAGSLSYASTGATTLTAATPISIGSYNQTAGTLIDNGSTITVTGTGASTWSQTAGIFTPTGSVIFTGAAPHIGTANFNNLTINVGAGNSATLTGNATLSGVLTMTSGRISTGANTLDVGANCVGVTGSSASYVLGNLRLHYPTNAGTTTCTFPIGDATAYTPVSVALTNVTSTLASSILTASTTAGDHLDTTAGTSGINGSKSVNRYWTLTPGALLTFASYNITFNFVAGDIDGGATTANFKIGRKNAGVWSYPTMGAANPLNTAATGMTQASGFGEFVIGELYPAITLTKLIDVFWDPVNLSVNPKFIPGALAQYTVITINAAGPADNNSTVITVPVPANTSLYVAGASGPVTFTQGTPSSNLSYTFTTLNNAVDNLDFSIDGGTTWTAVPVPGADGCDPTINAIRIKPQGSFVGSTTAPNPSAQFSFRVCVR